MDMVIPPGSVRRHGLSPCGEYVLPADMRAALTLIVTRTVIQVLLIGTLNYQFTEQGERVINDTLSWKFPLLIAANTAYLIAWFNRNFLVAFIIALHITALSSLMYFTVKRHHSAQNIYDDGTSDLSYGVVVAKELICYQPHSIHTRSALALAWMDNFYAFRGCVQSFQLETRPRT